MGRGQEIKQNWSFPGAYLGKYCYSDGSGRGTVSSGHPMAILKCGNVSCLWPKLHQPLIKGGRVDPPLFCPIDTGHSLVIVCGNFPKPLTRTSALDQGVGGGLSSRYSLPFFFPHKLITTNVNLLPMERKRKRCPLIATRTANHCSL